GELPMANTRDVMGWYSYTNDLDHEFQVQLTTAVATAGGFGGADSTKPELPRRAKMRHVGLYDVSGHKRHQLPCSTYDGAPYNSAGSVSLDGVDCLKTGRTGEKGWKAGG